MPWPCPLSDGLFHTCEIKRFVGPVFGAGNVILSGRNIELTDHKAAWASLAGVKNDLSTSVY